MPRTTPALVAGITETDSSIDLAPFILVANEIVTEVCTDSGYSNDRLELIERWLAAHFYHSKDQKFATEQAGPVKASYQYKLGLILQQTSEGQNAMLLDTAGNLAKLSKQIEKGISRFIPSIVFIGPVCEFCEEDCL